MTPEQIEIERKAFEAWVQRELNYGYNLTPGLGQAYAHDPTDNMWMAWEARAEKAERVREALEKAVPILYDCLQALGPCDHGVGICNCDIKRCIDAARAALKESTHG